MTQMQIARTRSVEGVQTSERSQSCAPAPVHARTPNAVTGLAFGRTVLRRTMTDQDLLDVNAGAFVMDDHGQLWKVRLVNANGYTLMPINRDFPDVAIDDDQTDVSADRMKAEFKLDTPGIAGMRYPSEPRRETIATAGSQLINIENSPLSFAHFSFDELQGQAVEPKGGKGPARVPPPQRMNDHVTIENSLPVLLAAYKANRSTAVKGVGGMKSDASKTKKDFNQKLQAFGYGTIDNFNFRPTDQDPKQFPGGAEGVHAKSPATVAAGSMAVDNEMSLSVFLDYLDASMTALGAPTRLKQLIVQSILRTAGTSGVSAEELHLTEDLRAEFVKFVLIVGKATGWDQAVGDTAASQPVPAELSGILTKTSAKPQITITKAEWDRLKKPPQGVDPLKSDVAGEIESDVTGKGKWERTDGLPNYPAVFTYLVNFHWQTIKTWVLKPGGVALAANRGKAVDRYGTGSPPQQVATATGKRGAKKTGK